MAPLVVHFLISLMLVVRAVSSRAQWKTLRPVDMAVLGTSVFELGKWKSQDIGVVPQRLLDRKTGWFDSRD